MASKKRNIKWESHFKLNNFISFSVKVKENIPFTWIFKGLYKKDNLWRIVMYFLLIVFLMSTVKKRAREWWTGDWESSKGDVLAVGKSHLSHCVLGIRVSYHLLALLLEDFQQIRIVFCSSVLWEAYCRWKYINTSSHFFIHFHILCLIKLLLWKHSNHAEWA